MHQMSVCRSLLTICLSVLFTQPFQTLGQTLSPLNPNCGHLTPNSKVRGGTEFLIAFPEIAGNPTSRTYNLQLAAITPGQSIQFTIWLDNVQRKAGTIPNQNIINVPLDNATFGPLALSGDYIFFNQSKLITVRASAAIQVYVNSQLPPYAYAYSAIPTPKLGTQYYAVSFGSASSDKNSFGVLVVIGTVDGTVVTVGLPSDSNAANSPIILTFNDHIYMNTASFQFTINARAVAQIKCILGDITGVRITATQPVAAISGSNRYEIQSGNDDTIMEQLFSVDTWQKTLATYVTGSINGNQVLSSIKVVSSMSNALITIGANSYSLATAGSFIQVYLSSQPNSSVLITATSPVQAALLISSSQPSPTVVSRNLGKRWTIGQLRPAMTILEGTDLWSSGFYFDTGLNGGTNSQFLLYIMTHTQFKDTLTIDGAALSQTWVAPSTGSTDLVSTYVQIASGTHVLSNTNGNSEMGAWVVASDANGGYALPLSFGIATKSCSQCAMVTCDRLDNDCDGQIDEEITDGKDNDLDGLIDEDDCDFDPNWIFYTVTAVGLAVAVATIVLVYYAHPN